MKTACILILCLVFLSACSPKLETICEGGRCVSSNSKTKQYSYTCGIFNKEYIRVSITNKIAMVTKGADVIAEGDIGLIHPRIIAKAACDNKEISLLIKDNFPMNISGKWHAPHDPELWELDFNENGSFKEVGFNINQSSGEKIYGNWEFLGAGKMTLGLYLQDKHAGNLICEFSRKDAFSCIGPNGVEIRYIKK